MQEKPYQVLGWASPDLIRSLWHEGCELSFGGEGIIHVWFRPQTKARALADGTPGLVSEKMGKVFVGVLYYRSREDVLTFFYTCGQRIISDFGWQWSWERDHQITL